jgi:class 3 adenylate cyclase/PAS domain-containing protein
MKTAEPRIDARAAALAELRRRAAAHHDPLLDRAIDEVARAVDAIALDRTAMAGQLAAADARGEREARRAATIGRVAETVNSSLEIDVVLRRVLDTAVEVMNAQRGFLMIANDRTGELELSVVHGLKPGALETEEMRPSQTAVRAVFESGQPISTADALRDPRFSTQHSVRGLRLRSIVCAPLSIRDKRIGVVYLDSQVTTNLFARGEGELLMAFAHQAALAIENARLFAEQRERLRHIERLEDRQARVLASITDGVITLDASRTIAGVNEAAASTLGIDASRLLGKPSSSLRESIPELEVLLANVAGYAGAFEVAGTHPTRGGLTLEIRIAPLDLGDTNEGTAVAITDLTERRRLERLHRDDVAQRIAIREAFSRYVAPHVVESLLLSPENVTLGGERTLATVMFADICGFTELAAKLEAEDVVDILNSLFAGAVATIFKHDGLLDKFYGDGLMAVFGPPRVRDDDAVRAVAVARELHRAAATIQAGGKPLALTVGLATGSVVAGHIGSPRRMDFTVIGDAANLAHRLQSAAMPGRILLDQTTYTRAGSPAAGRLEAKIKGIKSPVTVYEL